MAKKHAATNPTNEDQDERYFRLIQQALAVCQNYRPKFGQGSKAGLTLDDFQTLYRGDPFTLGSVSIRRCSMRLTKRREA